MNSTAITAYLRNCFPNSAWDGRLGPLFVAAAAVFIVLIAAI